MPNYLSAMTIKLNETTNLFDFNFNGSLNLNQSSSAYLLINNLKIQNNIFKQITNSSNIVSFANSLNKEIFTITNSNVGINVPLPNSDYSLHVGGATRIEGDIRASGNFITTSDKRYKKDIIRIENALEKINKLTGVTYKNISSSKRQSGLVAQEVNEVFPEVVNEDSAGYLSLAYGNMMGLIIEGMKELKNEIKEIKEHLKMT
jgi:hypothetical protein